MPTSCICAQAMLSVSRQRPSDFAHSKGLIYSKLGKRIEAIDCLVRSGNACPYNWSCWLKLAAVIDQQDEVGSLSCSIQA